MGTTRKPTTPRFGVYLDSTEVKWLNETRGRYLLRSGQDISTSNIVRAGIALLRDLDEGKLYRLLERHRGRRRTTG